MYGGKLCVSKLARLTYIYIVGRNFMSAICRKVLLKLAFRMQTFVKCNDASTLSIWTKEILAKT